MTTVNAALTDRMWWKARGLRQILRFNWPQYVLAVVMVLGACLSMTLPMPFVLRFVVSVGAGMALWWTAASMIASFWIYDASRLSEWTWLRALVPDRPKRWVNIHAGFDDTTEALARVFPSDWHRVLDMYNDLEMTEASIARARSGESSRAAECCRFDALPVGDGDADAVFLLFAAHEIRRPEARSQMWGEVFRILAPGGVMIVVEHMRDLANFAAFGPGFMHFLPANVWDNLDSEFAWRLERKVRVTPFVWAHVWRKPS